MASNYSFSVPVAEVLKSQSPALLATWTARCDADENIRDDDALPSPADMLASLADALERPQPIDSEPDVVVSRVASLLADSEPLVTVATRQLLHLEDVMLLSLPSSLPAPEAVEVRFRSHVVTSWVIAQTSALRLRRIALDALRHPLTGLLSKVAFREDLKRELEAGHGGTVQEWSVVAIDLDGFKKVNDTLGHAGGDAVLMQFAAALAAGVGVNGTAYHLSGDEFALIVRDADVSAIAVHASAAAACSFGAVVVRARDQWTPAALHDAADHELLRRKRAKKGWFERVRLVIFGGR